MQTELLQHIAQLSAAIIKNDLPLAQEEVYYLNNNFVITEDFKNIDDIINFSNLLNRSNMDIYSYVINNLQHLREQDKLIWQYKIFQLKLDGRKNVIIDFIQDNLSSATSNYKIASLINLAAFIQDYELLTTIRDSI